MGIQNLLPFLEKCTSPIHISAFRGQTVGVDGYCWLHRAAISCAAELVKGEPTDRYLTHCNKYIDILLNYDIKIIMVFDGRRLPAKLKTEERRQEAKKLAKKQALELLRLGKRDEAYKYFKQCVNVTHEMALNLIRICREKHIDCIVAPYEADAQLAFFSIKEIVDLVISEDSDLLLFGCKKVLYKMQDDGSGQLVDAHKLHVAMKLHQDQYSLDKFRHMCILSGCDYVDSLPGIGLKKALKFITLTQENNPNIFLDRIPRYLNMRNLTITSEYKASFMTADATFKHQLVYDPFKRQLIPLHPVDVDPVYCQEAGEMLSNDVAYELAKGNLDPKTMNLVDNWEPNIYNMSIYSIWAPVFIRRPRLKKLPTSTVVSARKRKLEEETDRENQLHDQQVEKELEFYKEPRLDDGLPSSSTQKEEPTEEPTSPILNNYSKNPFKKKKFRQFVDIPSAPSHSKIVKSQYFTGNIEAMIGIPGHSRMNDPVAAVPVEFQPDPQKYFSWYVPQLPKSYTDGTSSDTSGIIDSGLPTPENFSDSGSLSEFDNGLRQRMLQLNTDDTKKEDSLLHQGNSNVGPSNPEDESFLPQPGTSNSKSRKISQMIPGYVLSNENSEEEAYFDLCEIVLEVENSELAFPPLTSVENLKKVERKRNLEEDLAVIHKPKKQAKITDMFKRMP